MSKHAASRRSASFDGWSCSHRASAKPDADRVPAKGLRARATSRRAPVEISPRAALEARFEALARTYLEDESVRSMAGFVQHGSVSTLAHCIAVAKASLALATRLKLRIDESDLVVGALLHDFYLYDWHDRATARPHHATRHPLYAAENAVRRFGVNARIEGVIAAHMWPLPPTRIPRTKEAWVVCVADKWCALTEIVAARLPRALRACDARRLCACGTRRFDSACIADESACNARRSCMHRAPQDGCLRTAGGAASDCGPRVAGERVPGCDSPAADGSFAAGVHEPARVLHGAGSNEGCRS